jgi:tRNA (guanosine-2'-O-)-methyltransferase
MKRHHDDVFLPPVSGQSGSDRSERLLLPAPGPTPDWTAAEVVSALEPLTTEQRRECLKATLSRRLGSVCVVLDNPHDPYNGSAVLRSCDAFGIQRVHVVREREKFAASRLIAKGSQRWVDIIQHDAPTQAVAHLRATGHRILVTHPQGKLEPEALNQFDKVALVLGNERDGVGSPLTAAAADTVRIDMCGFVESLNMSVTAAILLYAATRGKKGDLSPQERENIYARWLRKSVPRADEVLDSFRE